MKRFFALLLLAIMPAVHAYSSEQLTLESGNCWIRVSSQESSQVLLAVQALQKDFKKVLGYTPSIFRTDGDRTGYRIVIINEATENSKTFISELKELDDFESHRVYVDATSNSIVLHGKDIRGTIYAIYSFSEQILGVPPLWYWCSWQPEVKSQIQMPADYDYFCPSPQVRYRAWFPNDQDLFVPWRRKSTDNNELWLETMLRLKLNTVEYTATVTNNGTLNGEALLYKKYGLVLTSHHMVALNNSFSNWDSYWKNVRGQSTVPALSVKDTVRLKEFWQYSIDCVMNSDVENLWQIAFRGKTDQPFWEVFSDAPSGDKARADIINQMVGIQYRMIKEATGEDDPFVRMTFYDEISSLMAKGYLKPPTARNMLWTFVAGRRDHYPYDDLVQWQNTDSVQLGYYMNLQFYSTGSHLAPGEGPWKMEDNYRYVQSKGKQTFSVVNAGNIREFLMEMAANAQMMWNADTYYTNDFLLRFCTQYFGAEHAEEVAQLYHHYYYSYWNPKKSDFPGGFDRQYVFQDLRHVQVIKQIHNTWSTFKANPLKEIGYESVSGRTFRIEGNNQVDSILTGTSREMVAFADICTRCEVLQPLLPEGSQTFFYDNLSAYAHYMYNIAKSTYYFVHAYKFKDDRYNDLSASLSAMEAAREALRASHHDIFNTWIDPEDKVAISEKIGFIKSHLEDEDNLTLTRELIQNFDFEINHDGVVNLQGNIGRGIPYGWLSKGQLKKGSNGLDSYGVNQGAANYHDGNVCWMNSVPMPDDFWLYQIIPSSKLKAGTYLIKCKLWAESGKLANCRLFANQNVQYYGKESDYTNVLTEGEVNTYAGYAGGSTSDFVLQNMQVEVTIESDQDLTLGIKTSNLKQDGTRATNNNTGWFKVDFFRIHLLAEIEDPDGIKSSFKLPSCKDAIYDLQGRQVQSSMRGGIPRGIYVKDNKKICVL